MPYRYMLRTLDADDVGTSRHEDERWLRVGDELEVDGQRLRVADKVLIPETDVDYFDAMLFLERASTDATDGGGYTF